MTSSLKHTGLILALVILLPATFFSLYEVWMLYQSESAAEEIYERELETIFFSINQYADDVASTWSSRANRMIIEADTSGGCAYFSSLFDDFQVFDGLFLKDTLGRWTTCPNPHDASLSSLIRAAARRLAEDTTRWERLRNYGAKGYRKIEGISLEDSARHTLLINMLAPDSGPYEFLGLLVDNERFIEQMVGPRLQAVAQEEFLLAVIRAADSVAVYQSDQVQPFSQIKTRPFWIFPGYRLALAWIGDTWQSEVNRRFNVNLTLIVLINLLLVLGVAFAFRNIRRAVHLAQAKSDFVSNVSHEIRTPLSLISMFAETLLMDRVPTETKRNQYYEIISQESKRLIGMVNNILSFSRMEAGKTQFRPEWVDLPALSQEVLANYQYHLEEQGFEVLLTHEGGLPKAFVDKEALAEALTNLIDNAIKYSRDTKKIRVSIGEKDQGVFVAVEDWGVGMPAEFQGRIFEKFFRIRDESLGAVQGTGIGLSVVKYIVEAHQGKIDLHSSPGEGSKFILWFPWVKSS